MQQKMRVGWFALGLAVYAAVGAWAPSSGLVRISQAVAAAPAALQQINLPYTFRDDMNSTWDVQPDGDINDGGNDLYDGGGHLFVNNQPYQPQGNSASFDPARNEIIFAAAPQNGVNVTRRIAVNPHQNWVRFTETFENSGAAPQKLQVHLNFNIGSPPTMNQAYMDPRRKADQIGLAIGNQQNFVAMVGAGRGSKVFPRFQVAAGSKDVDLFYDVDLPAKGTVSIVHLQVRRTSFDQCCSAMNDIKDKEYLKDLDPAIARTVVNFPRGEKYVGDTEILRGDIADVIELRGGDQYKGTIKEEHYKLQTSYGIVDLPVDRIIGLMNVGKFKPRQLLITTDGEIFGGELQSKSVKMEMSSGQTVDVPLGQIERLGYRKRPGEPEEWQFSSPIVLMRSGDRMKVQLPAEPLAVLTRYGWLKIKPDAISLVSFLTDEHGVHELHLVDGSHFLGLVEAPQLSFALGDTPGGQVVKFPTGTIAKLQFAPTPEPDDDDPTLTLSNDDVLVGALAGQLKLDTAFDTITVNAEQVARLQHAEGSAQDVQITLWDNTTVSGQLEVSDLQCQLKCGQAVQIPIALLQQYTQPLPQPSASQVEKIKQAVGELNADDWKQRDRAQATLVAMGPTVAGVLKGVRPSQPPEAQQRIDAVLAQLAKQKQAAAAAASPAAAGAPANPAEGNAPEAPAIPPGN